MDRRIRGLSWKRRMSHENKTSFAGLVPQDGCLLARRDYLSVGQIYLYDNPLLKESLNCRT